MKKTILAALVACVTLAGCSTTEYGHKKNELTGDTERNAMSTGLAIGAVVGFSAAAAVSTSGASLAYSALLGTGFFAYVGLENDLSDEETRLKLESLGITVEDKFDKVIVSFREDVTFDLQRTELKEEFKPTLNGVAMVLEKLDEKATFSIVGHADYTGPDKLNNYLSRERSEVVTEYLISQGVKPSNIVDYYGKSASEPKDYCLDLACMRRVELIIYKNDELIKIN